MQSICDCIPSNIPDVHKGTPKKKWIASDLCQQEIWIPSKRMEGGKTQLLPKSPSLSVLFIYSKLLCESKIVVLWYLHNYSRHYKTIGGPFTFPTNEKA